MTTFNLCTVPESAHDVNNIINCVNGCFGTEAMVNYPYPTEFVGHLPAWPVNASCDAALKVNPVTDSDYVIAI